jgi:hypothetical protein
MSDEPIKDWRGNEINVGDLILYSVKHSTSVEVNEAEVLGFGWFDGWRSAPQRTMQVRWIRSCDPENDEWRVVKNVTLTNLSTVTLIAKK